MNDFSEVQHGLECLSSGYDSKHGKSFRSVLDDIFSGVSTDIESLFNGWTGYFKKDTYIGCFSEHDKDDDKYGRLSMWRAYSEPQGVAIVIKADPFFSPSGLVNTYMSSVDYLDCEDFQDMFKNIYDNIVNEIEFIRTQNRQQIIAYTFQMFKFAALCTKHPGFKEEKEWRLVYVPSMERSAQLTKDVKSIRGIPQPVYKIALRSTQDGDTIDMTIPAILDRIIVGPSEYPMVTHEAFCDLLQDAGVSDPEKKVFISFIPLR